MRLGLESVRILAMEMTIGKVSLRLDGYSGVDLYSDGEIENDILRIVQSHIPPSEALAHETRWPILYHLSPERHNLLEWYPFDSNARLLEVGAGCGALTGLFTSRLHSVTAVELSRRRSEINAYRHQECANLNILVGDLANVPIEGQFRYVTLIGVLEYAGKFREGKTPYLDLLARAMSLLEPEGTMILALENRFGLKYWAGAPEDHTGVLFEGLEGYPENSEVATFGRRELEDLLEIAGLQTTHWYYPFPDYKLPTSIHSTLHPPSPGDLPEVSPAFDRPRFNLFNEKRVWQGLITEGLFEPFAHSFLVFCQPAVPKRSDA